MTADAGRLGPGWQYPLTYDNTTFATHRRNLALTYTGTDLTVQTFDADTWAVATAVIFGGLAYIDFPFQTMTQTLAATSEWSATDYSPGIDLSATEGINLGKHVITTQHRVRTHGIAAESLSAGDLVMMTNIVVHVTGDLLTHDGMLSPAVSSSADEMYSAIGICEKGTTVDGTAANHDKHVWNHPLGEFYNTSAWALLDHGIAWIELWR